MAGVAYLAADYFQDPQSFSEEMDAAVSSRERCRQRMLAARPVLLDFDQYSQRYRISCKVRPKGDDPARQAALWHNRLFNPNLPGDALVLAFRRNGSGPRPIPAGMMTPTRAASSGRWRNSRSGAACSFLYTGQFDLPHSRS